MALTKIRGNTQIKSASITNAEIASNAGIELSKLAEGAELIKRDGSVAFTGNIDAGSNKIVNVATPTASGDVANKAYVDQEVAAVANQVVNDLDPRLDAIEGRMGTAEADIDALEGRMTTAEGDIAALESDLAAEVSRASAAESSLASDLAAEELARAAADTTLQSNINAVVSDLADEVARAVAAEGALDSRLTTAEGDIVALEAADVVMDGRVTDLENGLSAETTARQNADAGLASDIAAEETRAMAAEAGLASDISAEETRAMAAEAGLASDISAEASARAAADTTLQGNIDAEESRAMAAEASLASDLAAEVVARAADVDAEESRAMAAEAGLASDISAEESRAMAAEAGLASDISAEASARAAADTAAAEYVQSGFDALNTDVGNLNSYIGLVSGELTQSIVDETNRAMAAEESLASDLADEVSRAMAAEAQALSDANTYTDTKVADLVNSAPAVLDTLKELADALGDDPNFATTVAGQVGAVAADLAAEVSRATAAEAAVAADLATEVAARIADVDAEESRAMAAEAGLASDIAAEASARAAEDLTFVKLDGTRTMTGNLLFPTAKGVHINYPTGGWGSAAVGRQATRVTEYYIDVRKKTNADGSQSSSRLGFETLDIYRDVVGSGGLVYESIYASYDSGSPSISIAHYDDNAGTVTPVMPAQPDHVAVKAYVDQEAAAVAGDLASEVSRATAAEASLASDLAAEVSRATGAEAGLASDIAAEESRAMAAEAGLASDISAEESRAMAAEAGLASDLAAEVSRATAAEGALDARVLDLEAVTHVTRESPTGSINGTNVSFSLANTPVLNSEHVYLNGLLQEPGVGNDYSISDGTITFAVAPVSGDRIRVSYRFIA